MLRLAAIADDFTGATDLATSLRERGLRVAVVLGASAVPTDSDDLDAVIVALKSRTAPVAEAVGDSLDSIRALGALEPQQYFVKYCSTFDSTPQGNIGPVLDAVLEELGETRTVVVPAFPDNHRTVRDGTLYVGGDLLSESSMRHHPLTPMTESRIARILGPQTKRPIAEVGLQAVRGGVDGLRNALEATSAGGAASYLVVDALTNDDLQTTQAATADWRLLSGSAGLAFGMSGPHDPSTQEFDAPDGRRLVVCGSASSKTRAQIATALAAGAAGRKLDVARLQDEPQAVVDEMLAWLDHLDADAIPIIYSVGSLADLRNAAEGPAGLTPAEAVEAALSQIVIQAVERLAVRRVVVAGGETSGAVATALGCRQLLIGPQIAPGVCWSLSTTASAVSVALALKSGNFGADDMFISAWEALV